MTRVKVKPEIYFWMISESQIAPQDIEIKFDKLDQWISGELDPTFKQLQSFTNYLKIPFGYAFLEEPPQEDIIESEFRTLKNVMPVISKNLKDVISDMSYKQGWLSEHRQKNGWEPLFENILLETDSKDIIKIAQQIKDDLNLSKDWFENNKNPKEAYNYLRQVLETKGFIVMQSGVVGNYKRRVLNISEFRGFALYDDFAPLIFVNSKDSDKGKIFTLIHEAVHLFYKNDDVIVEDSVLKNANETTINRITAEILMPKEIILEQWEYAGDLNSQVNNINKISNRIFVSSISLSIRLLQLGLINNEVVNEIQSQTSLNLQKKSKQNKGNFWHDYFAKYSQSFIQEVIAATEGGTITHSDAFQLLDVKAKNYEIVKERAIQYV
ncbi:MAG: ImmA/IrrE family metallo-endopeptidase [Clostridiaceae bacterium]|nr:ImmA/IrrE family metallo-endopeptidase [Clostridiaceae bacterium]